MPPFEWELERVRWAALRTAGGRDAAAVPDALRALAAATTPAEAEAAFRLLDNRIVLQGCLFEAAAYVIRPLLQILCAGHGAAQSYALDLLVELVGPTAYEAPASPGSGQGLLGACRARAREGLGVLYRLLGAARPADRSLALTVLAAVDPDPARLLWALWRLSETDPEREVRDAASELVAERVPPGPLLAGVCTYRTPAPEGLPEAGPASGVSGPWADLRQELDARLTLAAAALVRRLRVDERWTWIGVAQACAEAWDADWNGNAIVGRLLCELAAARLDEDPYAGPWA